jgi:hypothetical protein
MSIEDGTASRPPPGVDLIAAERQRQLEMEGHTPKHDALHDREELARAAIEYATPWRRRGAATRGWRNVPVAWPWADAEWKAYTGPRGADGYWTPEAAAGRVRELVKAGALLAAEIDRLNALSPPPPA